MYYIIAFITIVALELLYFWVAGRMNIVDRPNERSSHSKIVLRGGGIIFLIGVRLMGDKYGSMVDWPMAASSWDCRCWPS